MFFAPISVLVLVVVISPAGEATTVATSSTANPAPLVTSSSTTNPAPLVTSSSTANPAPPVASSSLTPPVSSSSSAPNVSSNATTSTPFCLPPCSVASVSPTTGPSPSEKSQVFSTTATTATTTTTANLTQAISPSPTTNFSTTSTSSLITSSTSYACSVASGDRTTVSTPKSNTTPSPCGKTCAKLGVEVSSEIFKDYSLEECTEARKRFSKALTMSYNDCKKYDDVEVSKVTIICIGGNDGMLFTEGKLCLDFKGDDDDFIEDVFRNKVETGKLSGDFPVIKGTAKFEAVGVSFKDWKAKEGECDKCEETGGPFLIERPCEVETECYSCKGLKTPTKESKDCVKYCPSSSAATTVSSLILAIGIFLSFSLQ